MKKLLLILAVMMLAAIPAHANFSCDSEIGNAILNKCVVHPPDQDTIFERENPLGVGVDLVIYEGNHPLLEEVTVEARFDLENEEESVFFVARVNVARLARGIFQSAE